MFTILDKDGEWGGHDRLKKCLAGNVVEQMNSGRSLLIQSAVHKHLSSTDFVPESVLGSGVTKAKGCTCSQRGLSLEEETDC